MAVEVYSPLEVFKFVQQNDQNVHTYGLPTAESLLTGSELLIITRYIREDENTTKPIISF
jgi:hypothetical protein